MATPRSRRSAVVGALAAATVVVVLISSGSVVGGLRSTGRLIVAPFNWALNVVAHPVADLFAGAANYSDVLKQNKQLRAELGILRAQSAQNQALRQQLAQITATTHLPFVGNVVSVVAQVTENSPTNFSASFVVNQGNQDGVLVGMPVVGGGGLIGRVIATTSHTATVLLISDATSIVGCTWATGNTSALVYGRGVNDQLAVSAVQITHPLTPGTVFSTNGLQGGLFPPGIPVAKVRSITLTPGSSTYDLTLDPSADLTHLSYVDILLWEPST